MNRILTLIFILALCVATFAQDSTSTAKKVVVGVTNASSTGTTRYRLAKLTGAPSKAVIAGTSDTDGVIGVVTAGAGTSLIATIQTAGEVLCDFDGATTAGDYVQISSSTAGKCHDAGSTVPASGQILGRVTSTHGSSGNYAMLLQLGRPTGSGSGGSQTPWEQGIDGGGFDLTNVASITVNGSGAGSLGLGEGVAPSLIANTVLDYAPVDVAAGGIAFVRPAAAATGIPHLTNAAGIMTETISAVVSADLNITATTCTNQFVSAISATGTGTCTTDTLAGAQHANQGTTITVLHGNAAGNPAFGAIVNADITNSTIDLTAKVTGVLPVANGGTGQSSGTVSFTIASGTSALGTSAISSGTCATAVTTTATGTATTDVVLWGFNTDVTGITGYAPVTSGALTIFANPISNNVVFRVCNLTTGSITPGAVTLNWRIIR